MYRVQLNEKTKKEFDKRIRSEQNSRIWRRLQGVILRAEKKSSREIAEFLGVTRDTVTHWVKDFLEGGLEGLVTLNYRKPVSVLEPYVEQIKEIATDKNNRISTMEELRYKVKEKFGVSIEYSWFSRWCKKKLIFLTRRLE